MLTGLNIKFYLHKEKRRKDLKCPIYLRITHNRKKVEIATDFFCHDHEFGETSQRTHKNRDINEGLSKLESKVHSSIRKLEEEGGFIDLYQIKEAIKGNSRGQINLLEFFSEHIEYVYNNPLLANNTKKRYLDTYKHLTSFIKNSKKRNDIAIRSVDFKFIKDFELFCLNQKTGKNEITTLHRNTVNKHLTRLKTVILKAYNEGILKTNPFFGIRMSYTPTTRTFLSQEELDSIESHSLGNNESLQKVRDIFVFSCYTGLRFKDAQNLRMDSIVKNKASSLIRLKQEKTDEYVELVILKPVQKIIERYNNAERKITGKVLPQISNQKVNSYLKVIAEMIGLKKELTHHVARHTCATTVLLSNDFPIEVVSKWLGHNSIRSTQVYGKITNKYMQEHADRLNKTLK